jgi:hypothetical protein
VIAQRFRFTGVAGRRGVDGINLLAIVVTILTGFFVLTGTWIAILALGLLAALGTDGVLRTHPLGRLRGPYAAASQVLLPTAFAVAAALFFRWVSTGYWGVAGTLLSGLLFAVVVYASYFSLDAQIVDGGLGRSVLIGAAYTGFFALIAVYYAFDLSLPAAALVAGVAGAVFSVEVFREAELDPADLLIVSLASGYLIAQVRWASGFVRLEGVLAALLLLLVFYIGTGLLLARTLRRLDQRVAVEFAVVGVAGLAVVLIGRLLVSS